MHDIEPYFKWREEYVSAEDERSPFFRQTYSEFQYSNKIYNYYIHPQWDTFGSETLYIKVIYVDYDKGYAFIELIGEWNDCLGNDIMFLKREVVDLMIKEGIYKYVLACENVLNFHSSDDSYYEEWWDDIKDEDGWVCIINTFDHVAKEMNRERLYHYVNYGPHLNDIDWRRKTPALAIKEVKKAMQKPAKKLAG